MTLTKEQIEAGLRACNHFSEAYPEEFTSELYEFILILEKELIKNSLDITLHDFNILDELKDMASIETFLKDALETENETYIAKVRDICSIAIKRINET